MPNIQIERGPVTAVRWEAGGFRYSVDIQGDMLAIEDNDDESVEILLDDAPEVLKAILEMVEAHSE